MQNNLKYKINAVRILSLKQVKKAFKGLKNKR